MKWAAENENVNNEPKKAKQQNNNISYASKTFTCSRLRVI